MMGDDACVNTIVYDVEYSCDMGVHTPTTHTGFAAFKQLLEMLFGFRTRLPARPRLGIQLLFAAVNALGSVAFVPSYRFVANKFTPPTFTVTDAVTVGMVLFAAPQKYW